MSENLNEMRPLARTSISLPQELLVQLDDLVARRSYPNRSHTITLILSEYFINSGHDRGFEVVVGTISLYYYNNIYGLPQQLAEMQYRYIDEVISSLHVQLVRHQTMEVILVQGPATKLEMIADEMAALRGVIYSKLQLIGSVIPPLHGEPPQA